MIISLDNLKAGIDPVGKIINADTLSALKLLPDDFVDCVVTSPPYWGLRNYGVEGQLGLESTLDEYIDKMLQITFELKRILKPTGVCFWNHGDCYGGSGCGKKDYRNNNKRSLSNPNLYCDKPNPQLKLTPKCLALQNYRLILRMIDEQGWILRNTIIWYKPNSMPASVKDRFSNSYEPVFMLVKNNDPIYYYNIKTGLMESKKPLGIHGKEGVDWDWKEIGVGYSNSKTKITEEQAEQLNSPMARVYRKKHRKKVSNWRSLDYWFDLDVVRVPHKTSIDEYKAKLPKSLNGKTNFGGGKGIIKYSTEEAIERRFALGKNPGDLWTIPTQPFPEAHFAVYPEKLISPMIISSCPKEICKKCGLARVRITKGTSISTRPAIRSKDKNNNIFSARRERYMTFDRLTVGWTNCDCKLENKWQAGIVLDPFMGSGTTGYVSEKLQRNWIGIELSQSYAKMAEKRIWQEKRQGKLRFG
jgi:DNA modification methylase